MKPATAPRGSRLCGHTVVAMVLDVPVADVVSLIGHRRGTRAQELRKALAARGVTCSKTQLTRHAEIPERAILHLSRPYGRNWHWMLQWDGTVYDPAGAWPDQQSRGWSITSFMELQPARAANRAEER